MCKELKGIYRIEASSLQPQQWSYLLSPVLGDPCNSERKAGAVCFLIEFSLKVNAVIIAVINGEKMRCSVNEQQ